MRRFCKLLDEAIQDEAKAKEFYTTVKSAVAEEYPEIEKSITAAIDLIAEAETSHGEYFKNLKKTLCP